MRITAQLKALASCLMSFFAFIIVVVRIGFVMNVPINGYTLLFSLCLFIVSALVVFKTRAIKTLVFFSLVMVLFAVVAFLMAKTYDTSWDGQGYHQSAVIAYKEGWNPIYQANIPFTERLPSQIFAESYPSALWEVQATIYAVTNTINSAKVVNFVVGVVALCTLYALMRKIKLGSILSALLAILIVFQPLYIIQFLSFMQDGFGYQLIIVAMASLLYFLIDKNSDWAIIMFILAEIFLASSKYSHLPMVLMLGLIFILVMGNRFLNKDYYFTKSLALVIAGLALFAFVFAYLPYGRNILFHHSAFYPTNIPELSGSVTYNNLPHNLENKYKLTQLLYGLFSASQRYESSDNRSSENIAELKIPFTFSERELVDSVKLYNNRAGAQGPLYSGILILSLIICVIMSFKAETLTQKYTFYGIYFFVFFIVIASLFVPTPNLIRYTSQTQILPFVMFVPLLAIFKRWYVHALGACLIILLFINNGVFMAFTIAKTIDEEKHINEQFTQMRNGGAVQVKAQQFHSNYTLLHEQHVSFTTVDRLTCKNVKRLYTSSTTTEYCEILLN